MKKKLRIGIIFSLFIQMLISKNVVLAEKITLSLVDDKSLQKTVIVEECDQNKDPVSRLITARLHDVAMSKIEGSSPKKYRQSMYKKLKNIQEEDTPNENKIPTVVPQTSDSISTKPLPVFWKTK